MDLCVPECTPQLLIQVCVAAKNIYMGSNSKIHLPSVGGSELGSTKQDGGTDWFLVRTNLGIYNKKMGEIAVKLLNVTGLMALIFGFIANLPNAISVAIGVMSLVWIGFRILMMRENWLLRRSERRKHERDNKTI